MVKQLILALPENRLATLLSQRKFEEAEAFARKFDLDPEVCEWGRDQGMTAYYTMYMYQYNIIMRILILLKLVRSCYTNLDIIFQ